MEIKIKYFSIDYPRLEKISQGDWIDLRVDNIKEWESGRFILTGKDKEKLASLPMLESVVKYEKGDIIKFGLGVAMELPNGYEAEIRPRSSTFKYFGLIQTNSVGTLDNSYNGNNDEWQIEFIAMRDGEIERFDRICQFRIWENQPSFNFKEVENLGNENRGGYGSTGKDSLIDWEKKETEPQAPSAPTKQKEEKEEQSQVDSNTGGWGEKQKVWVLQGESAEETWVFRSQEEALMFYAKRTTGDYWALTQSEIL